MSSEFYDSNRGSAVDQRAFGKNNRKNLKSRKTHKPGQTHRHGDHHIPSGYLGDRDVQVYICGGRKLRPAQYWAMMKALTGPMPTEPLFPLPRVVQAAPTAPVKDSKQSKQGRKGSGTAQNAEIRRLQGSRS